MTMEFKSVAPSVVEGKGGKGGILGLGCVGGSWRGKWLQSVSYVSVQQSLEAAALR